MQAGLTMMKLGAIRSPQDRHSLSFNPKSCRILRPETLPPTILVRRAADHLSAPVRALALRGSVCSPTSTDSSGVLRKREERWSQRLIGGVGRQPLMSGPSNLQQRQLLQRLRVSSSISPETMEVATTVFQYGTIFILPFYVVMTVFPKWELTKRLMETEIPYCILTTGYLVLLYLSWTPRSFGLLFSSDLGIPELPSIADMFSSKVTVASVWLHVLLVDLYVGRQIFLDGLKRDVHTRHSLALCLLMCPAGIVSHMVTKHVTLSLRNSQSRAQSAEQSSADGDREFLQPRDASSQPTLLQLRDLESTVEF